MTAKLHRIFVYGSLRRGEENHDIWFGRGATHVADGRILGAELVNLGEFCATVPTNDLTRVVVGEVYDVTRDVFQGIEAMEIDAGYQRRPVEVHHGPEGDRPAPIVADAYFYARPENVAAHPRVESGDWTRRDDSASGSVARREKRSR